MKKIWIVLIALGLAGGASAQRFSHGYYYRPRVSIGIGVGAFVPIVPYYGFGYAPIPMYRYGYMPHRTSPLQRQIADINREYDDKIWAVKHDHTLSHKERRRTIRQLKHEREQEIIKARRDYYRY